ncbi:Uncharacterised protein [Vibrio cholerae]|nr:Uncharacterised protein [Vibrio cholerae]
MDNDDRWVVTTRVCIFQFHTTPTHHRRLVIIGGHFHNTSQYRRSHTRGCRAIRFLHRFKQVTDTCAMQCRNKVDACKINETQSTV